MRSKARTHGSGNARMHGLGPSCALGRMNALHGNAQIIDIIGISGRVVEYIVAIDVTRARLPADAFLPSHGYDQQHTTSWIQEM